VSESQSFWEHLDELRDILIRVIAALLLCSVAAFCFKDFIFNIILAPQDGGFVTYRLLEQATSLFGSTGSSGIADGMSVRLIDTGLAHQFVIHV
jgi:sec-independent protein translocase protein TatC